MYLCIGNIHVGIVVSGVATVVARAVVVTLLLSMRTGEEEKETDLIVGATTGVSIIRLCHFALADESMSRVWLGKRSGVSPSVAVKYYLCHTNES